MKRRLAALAITGALVACHRAQNNASRASASSASASKPRASAAPSASAAPNRARANSGQPSAASVAPVTPEQQARYRKALAAGRLATKGDAAAAERAFSEALEAIPDDARAHSERGYARLVNGDLSGAEADFDKAFGASNDRKLTAQIWFNRGLVKERSGDGETARTYFAYSFDLNPSAAAHRKLTGKTFCPGGARRIEGKDFPSWLAVWKELSAADYRDAQPDSDVAVRTAYRAEPCESFCVGEADSDRFLHGFVPLANGGVRVFREIYPQTGGRCEGAPSLKSHDQVTDIITENWTVGMACSEDGQCMSSCEPPGEWRSSSAVLEPGDRKTLLIIDRAGVGETPEPRVVATPTGARIDNPGCTEPFEFRAKPATH